MKQLKFFTNEAQTIQAARNELAKKGVSANRLHVFIKDNIKHRYDGLIMQSERNREIINDRNKITLFVVLMAAGSLAIFYGWLSFLQFAVLAILASSLPSVIGRLIGSYYAKKEALKKVYFLVIDIEETDQSLVESIVKNKPGLVAQ